MFYTIEPYTIDYLAEDIDPEYAKTFEVKVYDDDKEDDDAGGNVATILVAIRYSKVYYISCHDLDKDEETGELMARLVSYENHEEAFRPEVAADDSVKKFFGNLMVNHPLKAADVINSSDVLYLCDNMYSLTDRVTDLYDIEVLRQSLVEAKKEARKILEECWPYYNDLERRYLAESSAE